MKDNYKPADKNLNNEHKINTEPNMPNKNDLTQLKFTEGALNLLFSGTDAKSPIIKQQNLELAKKIDNTINEIGEEAIQFTTIASILPLGIAPTAAFYLETSYARNKHISETIKNHNHMIQQALESGETSQIHQALNINNELITQIRNHISHTANRLHVLQKIAN